MNEHENPLILEVPVNNEKININIPEDNFKNQNHEELNVKRRKWFSFHKDNASKSQNIPLHEIVNIILYYQLSK